MQKEELTKEEQAEKDLIQKIVMESFDDLRNEENGEEAEPDLSDDPITMEIQMTMYDTKQGFAEYLWNLTKYRGLDEMVENKSTISFQEAIVVLEKARDEQIDEAIEKYKELFPETKYTERQILAAIIAQMHMYLFYEKNKVFDPLLLTGRFREVEQNTSED